MAARIPKLEPFDGTQPGPTQDLDQLTAQDFVPVVMQDFGHAPIHDFGQAAAQDPAPQPFPGPAQIPAPVTGYHRDIILPALIEISGAIRNHDRRLDTCVTRAEFEATTEELVKSQQAQERRIDALANAEAFAALVNENAELKEQLKSFKQVQGELVEGSRRIGQGAGEPERDDTLLLRRVSASEDPRSGRAGSPQVRPDLAGMSRHGTHVDDPIILSDDESYGASDDPAPHDLERLRVKMEIDDGDGDGNIMALEEGEAVDAAPVDQKALIKMTSNDETVVQTYEDYDIPDDQEERTTLLKSALAKARERSASPQFPVPLPATRVS